MAANTEDEKLMIAKIQDLFELCEKYQTARFSAFLDGAAQCLIKESFVHIYGFRTGFFGGYTESERRIFGVFPKWMEAEEYPVSAIKITHSFGGPLSHRDYLGSILSLGIDRNKTGDILIDGNTAYVFVMNDIAAYIQDNIQKIGSRGVKIECVDGNSIKVPEKRFELIETVAASERLDAVLAGVMRVSRSSASKLIESGRVSVNHRLVETSAYALSEGDLISVRGFGRMTLDAIGSLTRSGRRHMVLKKYI